MKHIYTQAELEAILQKAKARTGWDFSVMKTQRAAMPWDYVSEVKKRLAPEDSVLDIGTGGGERFLELAPYFGSGVGIDIDPEMVSTAQQNAKSIPNVKFILDDDNLAEVSGSFDVIVNRHAPFDLEAVKKHLKPAGLFITQQVGEKNMQNIKQVLGQETTVKDITREMLESAGFEVVDFREYNVEYVVEDIESLVFWLNALDMLHSDLRGQEALRTAKVLNRILAGNVDARGFATNEHRYLAVAKHQGMA